MVNDKEHQELKLQVLELQVAYFQQQMELNQHKLEKLDTMLRDERMKLMAIEKNDGTPL